ncbi:hypothetical protein M9Y10_029609 [Tritrichomonas musculus]|uniref:F5/8 type C domain-containing protein n=1 Tax=Tritrichomonas musculus TaxID=1915356 RepID=A0ABR2KNH7_9EUKA
MESKVILLNTNVIRDIHFQHYKKDFTFIVDGKKYQLSRFEADLLSPTIRLLHAIDKTVDYFYIDTHNDFPNCKFTDFLSLLSFTSQTYDLQKQYYFKRIFSLLGNDQESNRINVKYMDTITTDNVIDIIQNKPNFFYQNEFTEEIIDFISVNFTEIDQNKLKTLDVDILEMILKNDNLQIYDEDYLLEFIMNVYRWNPKATILLENVYFTNLSSEKFVNFMNNFDFNDFTSETWKLVREKIFNQHDEYNKPKMSRYQKSFVFTKKNGLNGIIKYLSEKVEGNIHYKNLINISSSSNQIINGNEYSPSSLCDFNDLSDNSMWSPNNQKNAFLIYDFKTRKIKLTDYTFHTPTTDTRDYPKSWIIEGSNDSKNWDKIDERKDESVMNDFNICHTFHCQNPKEEPYRYIRITSTGPCWNKSSRFYFDLSAVEFFGTLVKNYIQEKKRKSFFSFF